MRNLSRTSTFERLGDRITPTVNAFFTAGQLTILGDAADNAIVVSRDAVGAIRVNGGAVHILGGTPTVANTARLQIFGLGGNDALSLDEANGALPQANMFGGAGNDTLIGGAAADLLFGQAGNDSLFGNGGVDFLFGGAGNDVLTGGGGEDEVFGETGNDLMIWNSGDGSDLNEGGAGSDTVEVNGGNGAEIFVVTANGARVRFDRLPVSIDIGTSEALVVNANGGDDRITANGNLAALIALTVDGGAGNDGIFGGNGADVLLGGDGDDFIDGNQGNDVVFLGAGDDSFQWDPGDGSDTVEGQAGLDMMQFNGSGVDEAFDLSAVAGRLRLVRDVGNVVINANDLEQVSLAAFGGADQITVNDLSGADVTHVVVDLAGPSGFGGDAQNDTVTVFGASGNDAVGIVGAGSNYAVVGLDTFVAVRDSEAADSLVVNAMGGDDMVSATTLPAETARLTVDGGAGNDTLIGSQGSDVLIGGAGNDQLFGENGNDTFVWNSGDGSDLIAGGAGVDSAIVNGGNASETFAITANGPRVRVDNVNEILLDIGGTESLRVNGNGGVDVIRAGNGLAALTKITMDGGAGDDGLIGGDGDDLLLGGDGDDVISGGGGNDVTQMGAGNDVFVWSSGDGSDVVEGQAGSDRMVFHGSNDSENVRIAANGNRVGLFRDVDTVRMDLNDVEQIDFNALGGADTIFVNDLSATDLTTLNLNLNASTGVGDGQADAIIISGNDGDDSIQIASFENGARVAVATTSFSFVNITGAEAANDRLVVNTLGGNDVVDAGSLAANAIGLTLNGGAGNDQLLAGGGNDLVSGGAGDDMIFLETGDDTFVWNPGDGNDTVEGMAGRDTMIFNGNNLAENITISANGERVRFVRDAANVTMDLNDVERIDFIALGGADSIVVNDLSGADVTEINLNLAGVPGGGAGDAQADSVIVNGTNGADLIPVLGTAGGILVNGDFLSPNGLPFFMVITNVEATDSLRINGNGGDDTITAAGLKTPVKFIADGGAGNDTLIGSPGDDVLLGGFGNDTLRGGPGLDILDGGPGDNILIQD